MEPLEVNFYEQVEDELLKFAVIISKAKGKWVFCKHRDRDTNLKPICVYSVKGKTRENETLDEESFGMLFMADIFSFEGELHSEIEKTILTDKLVDNWTYPLIQPKLLAEAEKRGYL